MGAVIYGVWVKGGRGQGVVGRKGQGVQGVGVSGWPKEGVGKAQGASNRGEWGSGDSGTVVDRGQWGQRAVRDRGQRAGDREVGVGAHLGIKLLRVCFA